MSKEELRCKTDVFVRGIVGDQIWESAIVETVEKIAKQFYFLCND